MLLFSFFHLFFSHEHVQIITGPHEKKWWGKFFWVPFLKKINVFKNYAPAQDIVAEQKYFNTIFFSYEHNFFYISGSFFDKNLKSISPIPA